MICAVFYTIRNPSDPAADQVSAIHIAGSHIVFTAVKEKLLGGFLIFRM